MISVDEALAALAKLVSPTGLETVRLEQAAGRVLGAPVIAARSQPPFSASAMDGYALSEAQPGKIYEVIGEAAAGSGFSGPIERGQAVRIFTGAPVPDGATQILIQEDADRDGSQIKVRDNLDTANYIRPVGGDFREGDVFQPERRLSPGDVALLASMNAPQVQVHRKPVIAIIPTGDELVQPGETPGPDQIIASNSFGLKALLESEGADVRMIPIARDRTESLETGFRLAKDADLIVTVGGASVGDHDLVQKTALGSGLDLSFYKIAMRPGKPLMAGHFGKTTLIGLPGNPVSAMVCGHIFLRPIIRKFCGLPFEKLQREVAALKREIGKNGPREHYMRAVVSDVNGATKIEAFERQDSSLLSVLSSANALLVRAPNDSPKPAGTPMEFIRI